MSLEHFKNLYHIAKEEGIKSALERDFMETVRRHPALLTGLILGKSAYFGKIAPERVEYKPICQPLNQSAGEGRNPREIALDYITHGNSN
ncbi:MAG: hypothetical protein WCV90_00645 [Candidatus Woesearchaeota archaeon]|jgi:hypothetical protein